MTRNRKIILIAGLAGAYVAGYAICRSRGELVHQLTWSDENRAYHWITPGSYENRIQFILSVSDEDLRYARRIEIRRRILQVIYFPLILPESAFQWILKPEYEEGN